MPGAGGHGRARILRLGAALLALAAWVAPTAGASGATAVQIAPALTVPSEPATLVGVPSESELVAVAEPIPEAPAPAPAPESPPHAGRTRTLSNERTFTRWAHPEIAGGIYSRPTARSKLLAHIRLATEDGFPEVYLLLAERVDSAGREWVKTRIPGRPNGRQGWMLKELLGPLHLTHWAITVNLGARRLSAYYQGRLRMVAPVGVGKPSTPTPTGRFWIRERFRVTDPASPYWPYALGTADYSTLSEWPGGGVIGIHGPYGEPQLIPGDPSHGCIRMRSSDLARLAPEVTLGTPVRVVAG